MHHEFPPIAFLAAIFLLVPLPWHWRAGNVATISIIFWLFITNIIYGVDAIIWGTNVDIVIPVWCDITSKIIIGANYALPSACLCICIHLERVASLRQASTTTSEKRRRQWFEAFMCFALPVLFMGLHYIVQGHRFDIIEEYGCRPTTYVSIASIFLIWIPPVVMGITCLVFAALALRHFIRRRITFALHLNSSHSALTTSRYLRLILMSVVQMVWSLSVTIYTISFTLTVIPLRPWTSWDFVHSNFSRIDLYASAFTPQVILTNYYVLWWMVPASSFIFISFFAFGKDAIDEYNACFTWFRRRILRQDVSGHSKHSLISSPIARFKKNLKISVPIPQMSANPTSSVSSTLPAYTFPHPPTPNKYRNSLDNFDYESRSSQSYHIDEKSLDALPATPSTLHTPPTPLTPWSPPAPLTPPPRARAGAGHHAPASPISPRPVSYPSFGASHRIVSQDGA